MKKFMLTGCCIAALLAFSGCSSEAEPPTVKITISGIDRSVLPAGAQFFALSVFKEGDAIGKLPDAEIAEIKETDAKTILTGAVSEGFTMLVNPGAAFDLTFSCADFTVPGNYVLVLGASVDMKKDPETSLGKMYITGTGSNPGTRGAVTISHGVTISWGGNFLDNSGAGWTLKDSESEATLAFFNKE